MSINIITNNQPRELLTSHDLSDSERQDFDYYSDSELDELGYHFFRYRGQVYSMDNFMRTNSDELSDWDGVQGMTYFSGVLVKYTECGDGVIVARYWQ